MTVPTQADLAEIAARAAHDFRNLLAIILGNAELLGEDAADDATAQMLRLIQEAAERGTQIADDLGKAAADVRDAGQGNRPG